jgi:hypothetical protein
MKSRIFIILGGVFLYLNLQAQFKDYSLSNYKLPDLKRHQLDLNFNLNDAFYLLDNNVNDTIGNRTNLDFAGGLSPSYYYYRNTDKYQGSVSSFLSAGKSFSKGKEENKEKTEYRGFSENWIIDSKNRFFFRRNLFIEPNVNLSDYYYNYRFKNESESAGSSGKHESKNVGHTLNTEIELLFGKGRLEPIEDMRLALYILEELNKANRLKRIPGKEEINEFASLISALRNERFFDSRLKRIHEMEKVDEFLVSKDLISDYDATHFAIIMDNWYYASGPPRKTGWSISAGVREGMGRLHYKRNTWIDDILDNEWNAKSITSFIMGVLKLAYAKPLNLYWQLDYGAELAYGKRMRGDKLFVSNALGSIDFVATAFCTMGYYPNSRSSYVLRLSGNYSESKTDELYDDLSLVLLFSGNYYISPKVRLNFSVNSDYLKYNPQGIIWTGSGYRKRLFNSVSAGILYSII